MERKLENTAPVRKLGTFLALIGANLSVLETLNTNLRFVGGRNLVHQGQTDQAAYIFAASWV